MFSPLGRRRPLAHAGGSRAKALGGRDRVRLQQSGAHAANLVGLSELVPAKVVCPLAERFGVHTQLRRAVVSIPTNLVEGCARRSVRDYQRSVEVATGSAVEVRYLLTLACDLGLLSAAVVAPGRECSDHVVRALHQLQQALGRLSS